MTINRTSNGLPYPDANEFVTDTAAHIQALAEEMDRASLYAGWRNGDGTRLEAEGALGVSQTATGAGTTTVVSGITPCYFVAPASGAVRIEANAYLKSSSAGMEAAMQIEVRNGAGARVGSLVTVASNYGTEYVKSGGWCYCTGLTPGVQYNVRPFVRSGSTGTATLASPVYEVYPLARAIQTTTVATSPYIQ